MTETNDDIKYCVTSFTDLLGFSNHLEIGSDLRTKIGQEVIKRLEFLENSIERIISEKEKYPKHYPENLQYKRINDSIILTLDLPEILKPRIGEKVRNGMSVIEMDKFFPEEHDSFESFEEAYKTKILEAITELTQFIGLSSRIHSFITKNETENYYPGCKTVISSGFRKSFINSSNQEDYFSANFSFSNAYLAESQLKSGKFFIDHSILQMLSISGHIRNLLKIGSLINEKYNFDLFDDVENVLDVIQGSYKKSGSYEVSLFRKQYFFKELESNVISNLQLFPKLLPYLNKEKEFPENKFFQRIIKYYAEPIKKDNPSDDRKKYYFPWFDMETDIEGFNQLIIQGKSSIFEEINEKEAKKNLLSTKSLFLD